MKNTLTLLNSEGDILKASKYYLDSMSEYRFVIYDQYKQSIADLTLEGFDDFINGVITLRDSKNVEYLYPSFSKDMRPTLREIQLFKNGEYDVVNNLDEETKSFYNKLMLVINEHKRTGEDYGAIIKKHNIK